MFGFSIDQSIMHNGFLSWDYSYRLNNTKGDTKADVFLKKKKRNFALYRLCQLQTKMKYIVKIPKLGTMARGVSPGE